MTDEFTPTTEHVARNYIAGEDIYSRTPRARVIRRQEFDRWLAGVRAEAKAEALRGAADTLYLPLGGPVTYVDADYAEQLARVFLRTRADEIEVGAKS